MSHALDEALRLQREAARQGFDWDSLDGLWPKLAEELAELREATSQGPERSLDELGDLLFMVVNLARHLGLGPEQALAAANSKFQRRYAYVMQAQDQLPPLGAPGRLDAMEARWVEAKRRERGSAATDRGNAT